MNYIKPLTLAFAFAISAPVMAQTPGHTGMKDMPGMKAEAAKPADGTMADGEVRKIDKEQSKITLKHGEIKNLDMPGMTMVFRVKDAAMFDQVKEGDKVKFAADKVDGAITVTKIERAK